MAKLPQQLVRELAIPVQIRSLDLDIDGRRRAEVQNLRDHVGGKKGEGRSRKLRSQSGAQGARGLGNRPMLFLQRHENIRVAGADQPGPAVDEVDRAVRQADVVENALHLCVRYHLTNGCLHQIAEPRGLFDPRARFGPQMEKQLAAIDGRKEVLPEPRNQQECR